MLFVTAVNTRAKRDMKPERMKWRRRENIERGRRKASHVKKPLTRAKRGPEDEEEALRVKRRPEEEEEALRLKRRPESEGGEDKDRG